LNKLIEEQHYYIGLMSGTSIDGVDVALVEINKNQCKLKYSYLHPFEPKLKSDIAALCTPQANPKNQNRIELLGKLDNQLGLVFSDGVNELLARYNIDKSSIRAIGSHGQTIRHRPSHECPFTMQIGDANVIAYQTGIKTVSDFRRMDMAAGGQGAPLVPAFHQALMQNKSENRIILNLGGIANITYLPKDISQKVIGFDTGPANTLLDVFFKTLHPEECYDFDGNFAKQGKVDNSLLKLFLQDSYFKLPFPKSTGREYFNLEWLQTHLNKLEHAVSPQSIQATLLELTVQTITDAVKNIGQPNIQVYACGGGMHNGFLMQQLSFKLSKKVLTTSALGVDGDYLEAMTFAWLAHRRLEGLTGNLPSVTGAKQAKVLGAIYHP